MTSRESFALSTPEGDVDIMVDFVPFLKFSADAIVHASSVHEAKSANGPARTLSPEQRKQVVELVREFLYYNGQRVRVD